VAKETYYRQIEGRQTYNPLHTRSKNTCKSVCARARMCVCVCECVCVCVWVTSYVNDNFLLSRIMCTSS